MATTTDDNVDGDNYNYTVARASRFRSSHTGFYSFRSLGLHRREGERGRGERERQTDRQTDRQTNKQTYRETETERRRQTQRETKTERETQ